jgi:hypothetical protein
VVIRRAVLTLALYLLAVALAVGKATAARREWPSPPAWWLNSTTARCVINAESGGNVHNKRNPSYRGKWQMGWSEWRKFGGTGDPADASEAEQDWRAWLYYQRSGWHPWTDYDPC